MNFSGIELAKEVNSKCGPTLADFKNMLESDPEVQEKLKNLRDEVKAFAEKFPMPGFDQI